ncbi:hypothetical protein HK098_001527 [Nowakowskiella sp. JEL0407]|nr:hypothetical protein HK098_001527 [Nowakowskiella sp. JEL0407]
MADPEEKKLVSLLHSLNLQATHDLQNDLSDFLRSIPDHSIFNSDDVSQLLDRLSGSVLTCFESELRYRNTIAFLVYCRMKEKLVKAGLGVDFDFDELEKKSVLDEIQKIEESYLQKKIVSNPVQKLNKSDNQESDIALLQQIKALKSENTDLKIKLQNSEKELNSRLDYSRPVVGLKKMMERKNETIKNLQSRLSKYETVEPERDIKVTKG